ncbi:MAG: peptide-methionine (S)-S-oxide reductase [Candidatus Pacearchaeota archaeon]
MLFYTNKLQKNLQKKSKEQMQKVLKEKITTQIVKTKKFYKAGEYHQKYLKKMGDRKLPDIR